MTSTVWGVRGNMPLYKSIGQELRRMIVTESRSFRGEVTDEVFIHCAWYWSNIVQTNEWHKAFCHPDFTIYIIDFKIWEHFFAMNTTANWVPFTCQDPRGFLTTPDTNPFPVIQYQPRATAPFEHMLPSNTASAHASARGSTVNIQPPAHHHGLSNDEVEKLVRKEVNERLRTGVEGHYVGQKRGG